MLTIIIGVIGISLIIVAIANSAWIELGIIAVILLFLMMASSHERDDWNAYINARDYWKKSGKDRAKARKAWDDAARKEEESERTASEEKERKRNDRKVEKAIKRIREEYADDNEEEEIVYVTCDNCGKEAREISRVTYPNGATYVRYCCQYCGEKKLKKI